MTNPCASRSVAVQDAHVKVTNCGRYVASSASSRPYVFCSKRGGPNRGEKLSHADFALG